MTSPFGLKGPAPDIDALVAYLHDEHCDGDLYRGQTRAFPAVVPSACRKAVIPGSEDRAVVAIDQKLFGVVLDNSRQALVRHEMLEELIGCLGVGLGNLVAQQYGLASECLDATENIRMAAYFATREWPEYRQGPDSGVGVIYRFRQQDDELQPVDLELSSVAHWLSLGEWDGRFFEWFVRRGELETVFDRDRWPDYAMADQLATVSSLPLSAAWRTVIAGLERASDSLRDGLPNSHDAFAQRVLHIDWERTRVARQEGGFVKPRFIWESRVPLSYELWHRHEPRPGAGPLAWPDSDLSTPWPRVVPSLAIKQRLVGVENVVHRDGCDAFHFLHGSKRIVGFYRRELWPEPSEDPLYGELWNVAFLHLLHRYGDDFPAMDDPVEGALDRGYRVSGERHTRDARDFDDLHRGQLEDATDATADATTAGVGDWARLSGALDKLGDRSGALRAARKACETYPLSHVALLTMGRLLEQCGDKEPAYELFKRASEIAPDEPTVLLALSDMEYRLGNYAPAARYLDRVLATPDPLMIEYRLVEQRATLAGLLSEPAILELMMKRYQELGFSDTPIRQHIRELTNADRPPE
jgi:hypothetical protein